MALWEGVLRPWLWALPAPPLPPSPALPPPLTPSPIPIHCQPRVRQLFAPKRKETEAYGPVQAHLPQLIQDVSTGGLGIPRRPHGLGGRVGVQTLVFIPKVSSLPLGPGPLLSVSFS